MINETIQGLIVNGSIPLEVTLNSSTNWIQFATSIVTTLIGAFGILLLLYFPQLIGTMKSGSLKILAKISKRNVILIKHTERGMFGGSMIDQSTLTKMSEIMNKFKGEPFDLILHTPGGEVFSSLALSRLLKQYPGQIRAVIPLYSMSGGSLLALSTKELVMTPNASLGPIDPQLGNLFKYGSAKAWEEIVRMKGKKAEDSTISFAMMGKQYTKSIQNHLNNVIDFNLSTSQKEKLVKFLTDGNVEHAYPLTPVDLKKFGIEPKIITNDKYLKILGKILSSQGKEGIRYYKLKKGWFR